MTQQQVFKILSREKRWLTTIEIHSRIKQLSKPSVRRALNQMYKYKEISKRINARKNWVGGDSWRAHDNNEM